MRPPKGVPRDEWLLAIGLANHRIAPMVGCDVAAAIHPDRLQRDPGYGAAWNGAATMRGCSGWDTDENQPDSYAAGAALAMALEGP